jgi:hypothetical protein
LNSDGTTLRSVRLAAIGAVLAGIVSSGHHVYGALLYDTPWRLVVSLWIPAFVVLIVSALFVYQRYQGQLVGHAAVWIVLLGGAIFQFGFTAFECVYSHVLKNLLFFGGAAESTLLRLFPPPAYHLPDSLLFEITGISQLVGLWAAWLAWQVFRAR